MSQRHDHDLASDEVLVAFIDGELEPAEREALEALLQHDPALSARLAFLASGKLAFDDALGPLLAEAPTARMTQAITPSIGAPRPDFDRRRFVAAAAAFLVVGAAADRGFNAVFGQPPEPDRGWRASVSNYMALYSPQTLDAIGDDPTLHAQEVARIGQGVGLPLSLAAVQLSGKPFKRAQLLAFNDMNLAQLAYLDPLNGPMALCILHGSSGVAPLQSEQRDGMNLVFWSSPSHSFLLIGRSSVAELTAQATQIKAEIA